MSDRDKPRRYGDAYCSPGCGFKCSRKAYDRAVKESDALAKRLGHGWTPRVWENFGWNYSVEKGIAIVRPDRWPNGALSGDWNVVGYTVYFNSARQIIAKAGTPEDALGFAVQDARGVERKIAADLAEILDEVGAPRTPPPPPRPMAERATRARDGER